MTRLTGTYVSGCHKAHHAMQKDIVSVQHIIPLKMVDKLQPRRHKVHDALDLFGDPLPFSCQAIENAAAALSHWSAV